MPHELRQQQLTLLGQLEAARVVITLHADNGILDRHWWISGYTYDDDLILTWSSATAPGPRGGLNLAELLTQLLDIAALLRGDPQPSDLT